MTATCPSCHLAVGSLMEPSGLCLTCERRAQSMERWRAGVAAPKCPCGKPFLRCDECAALHCSAPGHLLHDCDVAHV